MSNYLRKIKRRQEKERREKFCKCVGCWKDFECDHSNYPRIKGHYTYCLFSCFECLKLAEQEIIIKCGECKKAVEGATFNSRERKIVYAKNYIIYFCSPCASKLIADFDRMNKKVRGVWIAIDSDKAQATAKGNLFNVIISKEKQTGEYYTGEFMDLC